MARLVGEALDALTGQQQDLLLPRFTTRKHVINHLGGSLEDAGLGDASVHAIRAFLVQQLPKVAGTDRAYVYLGVVGVANVDSQVLPEGWDIEVAELIDQHFGVLAAS
ncbi:hypothetical protein [Kitasatospora griseola]|uniref:hypothetical protein n=1 Tax=Kitasatospora griseola TaxID=2064 RepID=UPI003431FF02